MYADWNALVNFGDDDGFGGVENSLLVMRQEGRTIFLVFLKM